MDALLLERALKILAAREHSVAELRAKLARTGASDEAVSEVVAHCTKQHYVDDERYRSALVSSYLRRGKGTGAIRSRLQHSGVEGPVPVNEDDELAAALAAGRKKAATLSRLPPAERFERVARFLLGRGFPPGICRKVAKQVCTAAED